MKRQAYLEWNLAQFAVAGLLVGLAMGLIAVLVLVVIDLATDWTSSILLYIVMIYGVLGLSTGLGLGLLLRGQPATEDHTYDAERESGGRWSHLIRNLVQGIGAGLVAGAAVSLVEVLGLLIVDLSLWPLTGLLYAAIAYGALGLLGGLGLGLLRGLWCAWRDCDDGPTGRSAWVIIATLIVSVGTFLVVHNRVRRDVFKVPLLHLGLVESFLVDNVLLVSIIALGVGLWFLLHRFSRHARLVRFRWNVGLFVTLTLLAVLISGAVGAVAAPADPAPPLPTGIPPDLRDKPNVIFIVAETLRADRLDSYVQRATRVDGRDKHLTPRLDALAQDGVLYHQMSVQAPWTKPSVASMLTSLYPTSHGATTSKAILPDDVDTLPEILAAAGYRTAGFTTNVQTTHEFNFQQGYDEYTFLRPELPFFAFNIPISARFAVFRILLRVRSTFQPFTAHPHEEVYANAEVVNRHTLAWLEVNKGSRFFLFLHYFDPHDSYFAHPYDGTSVSHFVTPNPDPAQAPFNRKLYDGEVAFLDTHLGVLFDQLKAWELYDDTLIVFVADHGEEFYEHSGWWHCDTLYEELLVVPLIIKYPGSVRRPSEGERTAGNAYAGTVDEECAQSLDIAPTVLDVVGLPIPEAMQGVSLRPGAAVTRTEFLFAELDIAGTVRSIRTRRYKLITASEGNPRDLPALALFDLQMDPGEQKNLAQDKPETVRLLRAELDRVIAFAEAHAVAGQSRELDVDTWERLQQLGY